MGRRWKASARMHRPFEQTAVLLPPIVPFAVVLIEDARGGQAALEGGYSAYTATEEGALLDVAAARALFGDLVRPAWYHRASHGRAGP